MGSFVAIKLPPVSAQVELTSTGVLNLTLMRTAPIGGSVNTITGYTLRLSVSNEYFEIPFDISPYTDLVEIRESFPWEALMAVVDQPSFDWKSLGFSFNIQATSTDANYITSDWWPQDRVFPAMFTLGVSNPSPEVGSDVVFYLPTGYSDASLTRAIFIPDASDSTFVSLWKSFIPGMKFSHSYQAVQPVTAIVKVAADVQSPSYGSSYLIRSAALTITPVSSEVVTTGFNSWLGVGSSLGFSFTDTSTSNYSEGDFAVVLTGSAISSRNKELKMFLASSRSADANTYYQTVAWDLFPVPGRLKVPSFCPSATLTFDATRAYTDASLYAPLKFTKMQLPKLQVGYDYDIQLEASGGKPPYAFYVQDLPAGLTLTSQGRLVGSPLRSGLYQASVSVVDSEYPPQVDVKTLSLYVDTDLSISQLPFQYYSVDDPITTLLTAVGGVPPYTWQLNIGSDIIKSLGLDFVSTATYASIEGTPYDQGGQKLPYTFMVSVQVQDAVGSIALSTFECGIYPPKLRLKKICLDEFFEGESSTQYLSAIGGDNTNYNWGFTVVDSSKGLNPLTGLYDWPPQISFAPAGLVGSSNITYLRYDPQMEFESPEAYYRIKCSVTSGVAENSETSEQFFDLSISPALNDLIISTDTYLPYATPNLDWSLQLQLKYPLGFEAKHLQGLPSFTSPNLPPYLTLSNSGLLSVTDPSILASNLSSWFRVEVSQGRSRYFKDFHFVSTADETFGFSIHTLDAFDYNSSKYVAIGTQYKSLKTVSNDSCVTFKLYNSLAKRCVNDVSVFSYTGELPKGLSFSSMGFIYGIPLEVGEFPITVSGTAGGNTATYPCVIHVNPVYAYTHDLTHDVRVSLDRQPIASIVNPVSGQTFNYNNVGVGDFFADPNTPNILYAQELTTDADRPEGDYLSLRTNTDYSSLAPKTDPDLKDAAYESFTYKWDLSELPVKDRLNRSINAAVIGNDTSISPALILINNTRARRTYTISLVTSDIFNMESDKVNVSFDVETSWFCTASQTFEDTGVQASDESLTDGTTRIDLLGL